MLQNIQGKHVMYLAILGMDTSTNAVDLLVHLCTMMVALLTGTGDGEGHTGWMPSTDTGDLTQTLVCLTGQFLSMPTGSDTY